ncbi:MAG: hypothetical protein R2834_03180 [Rhodothermales bacterium]
MYNLPLNATLEAILQSSHPDRAAVNELVQRCYHFAHAYLKHRLRSGSLQDGAFGLQAEDLAMDCIAELFQRDDAGRFVVLEKYFASMPWRRMSAMDLHITLRRLCFSKVHENLFRSYREEDPNLSKIIRNIKEGVKKDAGLALIRHRENTWVVANGSEPDMKPSAPPEILEVHMMSALRPAGNTYEAVSAFRTFVEAHPHYSNAYPLSAFAQVLRGAFARLEAHEFETSESPVYGENDVEEAIQSATTEVQTSMVSTYVYRGKMSLDLFDTYFRTVKKLLAATFLSDASPARSQYDALRSYMPDLSREAYQIHHRNVLQYLFKLSRARMIDYLRVG